MGGVCSRDKGKNSSKFILYFCPSFNRRGRTRRQKKAGKIALSLFIVNCGGNERTKGTRRQDAGSKFIGSFAVAFTPYIYTRRTRYIVCRFRGNSFRASLEHRDNVPFFRAKLEHGLLCLWCNKSWKSRRATVEASRSSRLD
jgi:hypothetical protein